jgi:hypothetical protein
MPDAEMTEWLSKFFGDKPDSAPVPDGTPDEPEDEVRTWVKNLFDAANND